MNDFKSILTFANQLGLESPSAHSYKHVYHWLSRTAILYLLEADDGHRVMAKSGYGWTPQDAADACLAHRDWREALCARGIHEEVTVVPCYGWLSDPATILMEFVDGTRLDRVLVENVASAHSYVHTLGRALGAFHSRCLLNKPSSYRAAQRGLRKNLPRPMTPSVSNRHLQKVIPVIPAGDYAPYNAMVAPTGQLVLFDLRPMTEATTAHTSIAWFIYWSRKSSLSTSASLALESQFLKGHASMFGRDLGLFAHRQLCELIASSFLMRRAKIEIRRLRLTSVLRLVAKAFICRLRATEVGRVRRAS